MNNTLKIGFICGAWDLLHSGHIFTFKKCKKYCDFLVVGLHVDPSVERANKNKPIETVYERFCRLQACKYVDMIIPYETEEDLRNLLITQDIHIRFLGDDSKGGKITGRDIVPIKYIRRDHTYSSSGLRKRFK